MLFSSTGVIGAVSFAALVLLIIFRAWRHPLWQPTAAVVASLIISKSVAGSTLSEPLLVLAIAVCAHAATQRRDDRPSPDNSPVSVDPGVPRPRVGSGRS
jgi:hypothetical protein